jgi:RNA polymerase sigma factor (TIGR02999 family)
MSSELSRDELTAVLVAHAQGSQDAVDRLLPLVYRELRDLAAELMRRERPGHTLTPTAVVHEAYLRLIDNTRIDWKGRAHFFAIAAKEMRQVLVRHALNRKAQKRGGKATRITLNDDVAVTPVRTIDILALNEALGQLAALSPRQSRVFEFRALAGMSVAETAFILEVSERTVKEDWRAARAWLARELTSTGSP